MTINSHSHSTWSFDGVSTPREMAQAAVAAGLDVLCFTEHCDLPLPAAEQALFDGYREGFPALRREYHGAIKLLFGAELGQAHHYPAAAEAIIRENNFDFILGSVHQIRGKRDFYWLDYSAEDPEALLAQYFQELLELVKWGKFNSLAHLTYPFRQIGKHYPEENDITRHIGILNRIFALMVEKNIALEVNTGGLRFKGYERQDPWWDIVERYAAAGGKLITLGTDSHEAAHVTDNLDAAVRNLLIYGFKSAVYYEKGLPVSYNL